MELAKVGLAKEVVRLAADPPKGVKNASQQFLSYAGTLVAHLAERLDAADRAEGDQRREKKGDALVKAFLRDRDQVGATKDDADTLIRTVEATLEGSLGDEAVGRALASIRRKHKLTEAVLEPVTDFDGLSRDLKNLRFTRREAYGGSS